MNNCKRCVAGEHFCLEWGFHLLYITFQVETIIPERVEPREFKTNNTKMMYKSLQANLPLALTCRHDYELDADYGTLPPRVLASVTTKGIQSGTECFGDPSCSWEPKIPSFLFEFSSQQKKLFWIRYFLLPSHSKPDSPVLSTGKKHPVDQKDSRVIVPRVNEQSWIL